MVRGDFKTILKEITTAPALAQLQRVFPRVMLAKKNNATLSEVIEAIKAIDPDLIAAVETEYRVAQIPKVCGCTVEEDKTLCPETPTALVNTSYGDDIASIDAAVAAAGRFGLPFAALHDINNVHPLYFSSQNSKRLFSAEKLMKRFDDHLRAIKDLLKKSPSPVDQIKIAIKEKIPKVDDEIVLHILNDSRYISFDGKSSHYFMTKKAVAEEQSAAEAIDMASRHMGMCDECGKRGAVFCSTRGGKDKYCEPCWAAYLKQ